jgi:uncharacterized protein (DUF433 family)
MRQTESMSEPSIITRDPEIMSGTPCFRGTRVPFQTLLDYLEGGETLDEFLEQFPTVSRDMAIAALETAKDKLLASIGSRSCWTNAFPKTFTRASSDTTARQFLKLALPVRRTVSC